MPSLIRADRHRALSNVFEQLAVADVLNVRAYVCVHKAYASACA